MDDSTILDRIRVASPCNARWEDMTGDDRARFCGQCRKHVYNFSAMTAAEVETLVREKEGRLCGRFYQRPDGRVLTADCPSGVALRRHRAARWTGSVFASLLFLFGAGLLARAQEKKAGAAGKGISSSQAVKPPSQKRSEPLMGDICVMPRPVSTNPPPLMGKISLTPTPPVAGTNKTSLRDRVRVTMGRESAPSSTPNNK